MHAGSGAFWSKSYPILTPTSAPSMETSHSRRDLSIASEATHAASRGAERNLQISLRSSATELSAKLRCGCCTLQMPLVYAALKRRCWFVQPGSMCRNCSYFFFDNLPAGLVPGFRSPLGADAMQRNHKWVHDLLPCDLERVDAAGAAEAEDKELPGIDQDGVHHGVIGAKERIGAAGACPAAAAAASGDRWSASRSTRASTAAVADALGARQSIGTQAYVPAEELRACGVRHGQFAAADDDDDDDDDDSGGDSSCAEHSVPSWDKADPDFDDGTATPMPNRANVTAAAARSSRLSSALAPAADTVEQKHEVDNSTTLFKSRVLFARSDTWLIPPPPPPSPAPTAAAAAAAALLHLFSLSAHTLG